MELMHTTIVVFLIIGNFYAAFSTPIPRGYAPINVEMPAFTIVSKGSNYQVRRYQSQIWAEVEYDVDPSADYGERSWIGFQPLFQYITGKNDRNEKIPMTAPVITQQVPSDTNRRRMAFIMPASMYKTRSQLPQPIDPSVKIITVDQPLNLACITFNMDMNSALLQQKENELRTAAASDGIALVTQPESIRVGGYNPPGTPPNQRTNDVCIPLVNQA